MAVDPPAVVTTQAAAAAGISGLTLVLGGSRSGKSRWAETLADRSGLPVLYLATAAHRPDDAAWCERLERHQRRRPPHWSCLETGAELAGMLRQLQEPSHPQRGHLLLVDALGTWLAQHLSDDSAAWTVRQQALLSALQSHRPPVLLVCEEVGLGVVPATPGGGLFRDRMGELQQALMAQASGSWLVVAGRALDLHTLGQAVPEV
ncbi:MAG: bifunctional adenosylcobinamide kinase/adenosylcobinamide-phosphate guanylyltransferase [Vulcanococcus sp.]